MEDAPTRIMAKKSRGRTSSTKVSSKDSTRRARVAPKANLSAIVKSILNKNIETKMSGVDGVSRFNGTITGAGDILSLMPSTRQGLTDENRLGNTIVPIKLRVRVTVSQPDDSLLLGGLTRPIGVRLMVLSSRAVRKATSLGNVVPDLALMLKTGITGAAVVGFTGQVRDLLLPINQDLFQVHGDETISICPNVPYIFTGSGVEQYASGKNWHSYTCEFKLPKLKYNEDTDNFPENSAPFLCIGYTYPNGDAADTVNQGLYCQYTSHLYYKDA